MRTDTASPVTVMLARQVRALREILTRARRDTTCDQTEEHTRNLIKRVESGRVQLHDHLVELLHDAMRRGAPREDVEAYPRALLAMIGEWCADEPADVVALIRRETRAQAVADIAETEVWLDPSTKTIADTTERVDAHLVALEDLSLALHQRALAPRARIA